jgi:hypothetical protein
MPNLTLRNIILNDDIETLSLHPDWYLAEQKDELLSFAQEHSSQNVVKYLTNNIHKKSEKLDKEPVNLAMHYKNSVDLSNSFSENDFDKIMEDDEAMEEVA